VKIACVSDIHGNYEALLSVFEDVNENGVDFILCGGDIVGYYPNPIECIEIVRNQCKYIIRGNHDEVVTSPDFNKQINWFNPYARKSLQWTRNCLCKLDYQAHFDFLASLPTQKEIMIEDNKILLAHGTPEKPWEYFIYPFWADNPPFEYELRIDRWFKSWDLVIIGHTHQAFVYNSKTSSKILLNPGSVGQPRDYNPKASYAIIEIDKSKIQARIIRIEYEISETCKSISAASLDDYLCERLYVGR
jgi:putative phosphoesterase